VSPQRLAVVVVATLVIQVSFLSRFSYEGARPDAMVLLAILAGFSMGPERGALVGFVSGLAFDLVLSTPMGLSALVYTVVASGGVVRTSRLLPSLVAAVGSAAAMVLYAVVGVVIGEPTLDGPPLTAIVVYVAAINAALAPLANRALAWTQIDEQPRRHRFLPR
jgi:rod shape-determining protein MreD